MSPSEICRKAYRIIETAESEEAVILAARALKEYESDDVDQAMLDLEQACKMEV